MKKIKTEAEIEEAKARRREAARKRYWREKKCRTFFRMWAVVPEILKYAESLREKK